MTPYADFKFYKDTWKGSLVKEAAFSNLAIKATAEIDRITFHRIKDVTEDIRLATCAVIDTMFEIAGATAGHLGKKAETVGNHSVTYGEELQIGSAGYHNMLYDAAYPYLMDTGFLYRGVNYHDG